MRLEIIVFSFCIAFASNIFAFKCDVDLKLEDLKTNTKEFLNRKVLKRGKNCSKDYFQYFRDEQVKNLNVGFIKDEWRSTLCHYDSKTGQKVCLYDIKPGQDVPSVKAPIESLDRVENLVGSEDVLSDAVEMEKKNLLSGQAEIKPWSDWYWPIYVGQLSYRYADTNMIEEFNYSSFEPEEMWSFMQDWHTREANLPLMVNPNLLSPAEKYDLLVGDTNFSLTKYMLDNPARYAKDGKVESWMGICHGWAPASYMVKRPRKSISVRGFDGSRITFRPSDLKALASQSWATGNSRSRFIGGRCNIKDPKQDENGRVVDAECFDNNPGSWHMAIVNQIGVRQKSFVMDATFDIEVWNHPVFNYSYSYFNPKTMIEYSSLKDAAVKLKKFSSDKFKKYRSDEAKFVVGIKMEVGYLVETNPNSYAFDNEELDAFNTAYYIYDLELDKDYKILGGEWYTNMHPDFLWTPYEDAKARSRYDFLLPENVGLKKLSTIEKLPEVAREASQSGQVLGKVIDALIEKSSAIDE